MVLLASEYDKRRFFVADDLESERKLRIKSVTAEVIGIGAEKDDKLVVWFTNDKRGLVPTTASCGQHSETIRLAGPTR